MEFAFDTKNARKSSMTIGDTSFQIYSLESKEAKEKPEDMVKRLILSNLKRIQDFSA